MLSRKKPRTSSDSISSKDSHCSKAKKMATVHDIQVTNKNVSCAAVHSAPSAMQAMYLLY